jgi:anaerobic magnesium-protoporphyrin IX monomethyl ester cyclase
MKILFTHSYFLQFDPKQVAHAQPYAPLGTILAAGLLRENNFDVRLFDTMFANSADEIIPQLESFKPDLLVVYDDGFNYLTKMCLSNMREAAFRMQRLAKEYGCKVIMTSSDAADHYEKYLTNGADFVIIGEAEHTLLELVNTIRKKETDYSSIPGLAFNVDNKTTLTAKRSISKKLDELPLPAWDLVDIEPYRKVWLTKHGYFSINVATTRGCPYSCNWCAKPMYGDAYNMRSPQHVVAELIYLKEKFAFDHIWFCDDIFGLKRTWVADFASLVKKENLFFTYKIQSRADLLVQEKYVENLAASGCTDVWMGAESGSQKILDAMDKGTTVEQIKAARRLLKQYKIKASFFLQFGYLGETMEDIQKTISLIKETLPDDIGISVSYPLPGTGFYEKVKKEMTHKTNWTDSDELAMLFNGTYNPGFYKQLQRYVHRVYRRLMGLHSARLLFSEPSAKHLRSALSLCLVIPRELAEKRKLKKLEPDATASL